MLTVYVKDNCRHSRKVLDALEEYGVPFEKKNIKDPEIALELMERGGKYQVPFLEDDDPTVAVQDRTPYVVDGEVEMYESNDIVRYIERYYGNKESGEATDTSQGNVRLHVEDDSDVCDGCE